MIIIQFLYSQNIDTQPGLKSDKIRQIVRLQFHYHFFLVFVAPLHSQSVGVFLAAPHKSIVSYFPIMAIRLVLRPYDNWFVMLCLYVFSCLMHLVV